MSRFNRNVARRSIARVFDPSGRKPHGMGLFLGDRYFVTACHCLPPLSDFSGLALGDRLPVKLCSLDRKKRAVAQVVFADPFGDVAVLCAIDERYGEFESLQAEHVPAESIWVEPALPLEQLRKRGTPFVEHRVHWLSHKGAWFSAVATGSHLRLKAGQHIEGGTSGTPVFANDGAVVGVISNANVDEPTGGMSLAWAGLPGRILDRLHPWRR